ncbi:MAG TPA: hypothetical protein VFB29_13915 [Pseudolabrys sp.]|nr:hypothetical protein [Pseudolabrys sp.]
MRTTILSMLLATTLAATAQAQGYPVSGKWGESSDPAKGAIDCTNNRRVIEFSGDQRTDSNGGVPAYRNKSVVSAGPSTFRVVDEFSNAQVNAGQSAYTLRKIDADHIEIDNVDGSTLKLQRCK